MQEPEIERGREEKKDAAKKREKERKGEGERERDCDLLVDMHVYI